MGEFTGDFNSLTIEPGIYQTAGTYTNGPSNGYWGIFIQFNGHYYTQVVINTNQIAVKRYVGNPSAWSRWSVVNLVYDNSE